MIHLPDPINDLGIILITAAITTLVFRLLKQPVVLGYLVAGLLIGPHVPFIPTVTELGSIKVWAEMGVIFLLFGLGLEFSFKKLADVGKSASIVASIEVLFMLGLGYLSGQAFGWSQMDSLFLGGILSISSTTIIVKAFEGLCLKGNKFVSVVFGVLIVEDLFAILLLVLLSTLAVTQSLSGSALLVSSLQLGFFLILWFLVGIYALPVILRYIRKQLTDETVLIISIGLCLMMVILSTKVGFSPALGAFVMGSILAETREGKRIEHLLVPVRDLFAAIFFVSVGMMMDPRVIVNHWSAILIITALTITGKFLSTTLGAVLSGQSLKHSVQSGMSLAQIGEFSFIIATLGLSLNVTSDFLYPIAVAVSVITTFTTPYFIQYSEPFYRWLEKRIPKTVLRRLDKYQTAMSAKSEDSIFTILRKAYGPMLLLNSVMVIAITLGVKKYVLPYMRESFGNSHWVVFGSGMGALFLSAPFFWPILFGKPKMMDTRAWERFRGLQLGLGLLRLIGALMLVGFVVTQFSSLRAGSGLVLVGFVLLLTFLSKRSEGFYKMFERRFISNLKENHEKKPRRKLAPWDASLSEFVLSPNSSLAGKTLLESSLKEKYGVTVTVIERGHEKILAPTKEAQLLPYDRLFLIGSDSQLEAVRPVLEVGKPPSEIDEEETFGLERLDLGANSPFVGKTIRNCGLREAIHGLIVGLERNEDRILNPDSSTMLREGDLVWVVGDRKLIRSVRNRVLA